MTIDADGAPNAYHPENLGLDDLSNAGTPGRWEGLAKDADGQPYIQGPDDPFPGYYVSATALMDRTKAVSDPARYVDASKIPFVVLPGGMARQLGARPGDFAVVFNRRNGRSSFAIFGDVGPFDRIGEGSMALAENLGIRSDARNGGARRGILYLVFPGSGEGKPRTIEEIDTEGRRLLLDWQLSIPQAACAEQQRAGGTEATSGAN
jgi:Fungal chitosanase of glycosyl hydrolase group 75